MNIVYKSVIFSLLFSFGSGISVKAAKSADSFGCLLKNVGQMLTIKMTLTPFEDSFQAKMGFMLGIDEHSLINLPDEYFFFQREDGSHYLFTKTGNGVLQNITFLFYPPTISKSGEPEMISILGVDYEEKSICNTEAIDDNN
jgi:hypothetical protein